MTLVKGKRGFTLIELLIVVGIIAVLAAIAIPIVAGVIGKANSSKDATNAANMSEAIEQWALEYPLFYSDYKSTGKIKDTATHERVTNAMTHMGYIGNIEGSKLRGFAGTVIDGETYFPKGVDEMETTMRLMGLFQVYLKANNDIMIPAQSNKAFWYLTNSSIVICADNDATATELFSLASGKTHESPNGEWINITKIYKTSKNVEITVTLEKQGFGGRVSGGGQYKVGDKVTVLARGDEEDFKGWYDASGVLVTTDTEHTFTVLTNTKLIAIYGEGCELVLSTSGNGTVVGGGQFATNSSVTVTATPSASTTFVGWYDNGVLVSSDASYTFTITTNTQLVATFQNVYYRVTLSSVTGGTVTGAGQYPTGQSVTVTALASSGYSFAGWYRGENLVSSEASYTFTVSGNVALTAKFNLEKRTISARYVLSKGGIEIDATKLSAQPSITGTGEVGYGETHRVSITQNYLWTVSRVTKNSTTIGTAASVSAETTEDVEYVFYLEYTQALDNLMLPTGASYASQKDGVTYPEHTYWSELPELTVGDVYSCGDYTYTYHNGSMNFPNDYTYTAGWNLKVKSGSLSKTSLGEILPKVRNKSITTAYSAFENSKIVQSPNLPSTIEDLQYAYKNCTNLQTVPEIPNKVYSLFCAFEDCTSLQSVYNTLPSNLYDMGSIFQGCTNLTTVNIQIPNTVELIDGAFSDCRNLTNTPETALLIPSSVSEISGCFEGIEKNFFIYDNNNDSVSSMMQNLMRQNPKVFVRISETVKPYISAEGITGGSNAYSNPDKLVASSVSRFNFTPSQSGIYGFIEYDRNATLSSTTTINSIDELYYEYDYGTCDCGNISLTMPPVVIENITLPLTIESYNRTHDSYGIILNGTTKVTYNNDGGNSCTLLKDKIFEDVSYYEESYCSNCECYPYVERYMRFSAISKGLHMMYYMRPTLSNGTTYTIYSLPYSSSSTTVDRSIYVLINYQG